jgi:hypothetical protein
MRGSGSYNAFSKLLQLSLWQWICEHKCRNGREGFVGEEDSSQIFSVEYKFEASH